MTTRREQTVATIAEQRVSAIIRAGEADLAAGAMNAAVEGGFQVVEFTLTTPSALELITEFAGRSGLTVGAGTVLTVEDARAAVEAGARFLVSPVCDPVVIEEAARLDAACIPGTFTATEMWTAHRAGADFVKLFPAPADVASYVAAILGPLPMLKVFPTNGVTADNMAEVLDAGAAGVGFVKPLFDPAAMAARDFAAIRARAEGIHRRLAEWRGSP